MIRFSKEGLENITRFINECYAKRKEVLDAGIDTTDDTNIPTIDDIRSDIPSFTDEDGDYFNGWGVTDNYNSDGVLGLDSNDFMDITEDNTEEEKSKYRY